jgi:hypothetical protein
MTSHLRIGLIAKAINIGAALPAVQNSAAVKSSTRIPPALGSPRERVKTQRA